MDRGNEHPPPPPIRLIMVMPMAPHSSLSIHRSQKYRFALVNDSYHKFIFERRSDFLAMENDRADSLRVILIAAIYSLVVTRMTIWVCSRSLRSVWFCLKNLLKNNGRLRLLTFPASFSELIRLSCSCILWRLARKRESGSLLSTAWQVFL